MVSVASAEVESAAASEVVKAAIWSVVSALTCVLPSELTCAALSAEIVPGAIAAREAVDSAFSAEVASARNSDVVSALA